jgi:hypothetical protein
VAGHTFEQIALSGKIRIMVFANLFEFRSGNHSFLMSQSLACNACQAVTVPNFGDGSFAAGGRRFSLTNQNCPRHAEI